MYAVTVVQPGGGVVEFGLFDVMPGETAARGGGRLRHVAWVCVGVRVVVVVLGVCVGFVVGRGSCVVVNRAVGCLQRKQVHCAVFIDSNEWLVIVM